MNNQPRKRIGHDAAEFAKQRELDALRAENERLKSLLAVYRDCEICKHGQNPSLELEPGEEFEKHCKWCESGDVNNWELADQALKGDDA